MDFISKLGAIFLFSFFFLFEEVLASITTTWERGPYLYSIRQGGLGNAFTAIANDEYLLFANPAGLGVKKKFLKSEEESVFYYPLLSGDEIIIYDELLNFYKKKGKEEKFVPYFLNNLDNHFKEKVKDIESLRFKPPLLQFSRVSDFWGMTFVPLLIDVQRTDDRKVELRETSQFSLGFKPVTLSFSEDDRKKFHFGFALRPYYRWVSSLLFKDDDSGVELKLDEGLGVALDIGVLWELGFEKGHQVNVGLALIDSPSFYYPVFNKSIRKILEEEGFLKEEGFEVDLKFKKNEFQWLQPNPKLGVAYFFPNHLEPFFYDTVLSFDVHRWIDRGQHWKTKLHAGLGTSFFHSSHFILNGNVGFNGGYLTTSVIVYALGLRFGYLFYQEEIRSESEMNPKSIFSKHDYPQPRQEFTLSVYF